MFSAPFEKDDWFSLREHSVCVTRDKFYPERTGEYPLFGDSTENTMIT